MSTTSCALCALEYAERGYCVLPCTAKRPLTRHGVHDASRDAETIRSWWTRWPHAAVAIACGEIVVVDVDQGARWPTDESQIDDLGRAGAIAVTPRGGRHYYYRVPDGMQCQSSVSRIAPHVDVRGTGGYVVAPPSRTDSGEYRWVVELPPIRELPTPPEWLLALLCERRPATPGVWQTAPTHVDRGIRNTTLTRLAGALRRVGMDADEIYAALVAANAKRCQPPLPDEEVRTVARSVARYHPSQIQAAWMRGDDLVLAAESASQLDMPSLADVTEQPVEWLWHGYLPRGKVALLAGAPKVGKSFVTCDLAARVSAGLPWPDRAAWIMARAGIESAVAPRGSVIMIAAEDAPEDTIRPRCRVAGGDLNKIYCLRGKRIVREGREQVLDWTLADVAALEDAIRQIGDVRLVIIDPIMHYVGAAEVYRDSTAREALRPLLGLAAESSACILLVTHTRKAYAATADDMVMGARAFVGLPRSIMHVTLDPDDRTVRHVVQTQSQYGPTMPGFRMRIVGEPPRVQWDESVDASDVDAIYARWSGGGERRSRRGASDQDADTTRQG